MTAGCRYLERTFHAFLSSNVAEIVFKMTLLLVEFFAGIYFQGFIDGRAIEEVDHVHQGVHAINIEVVDHGSLAYVLTRHNQTFVFVCTSFDGDGQSTANRIQTAVKSQFAHHHKLFQLTAVYLIVGSQDADGQRQVITTAFLLNVGRRHVNGDIGIGKTKARVVECCTNTVDTLAYGSVGKTRHVDVYTTYNVYFVGYGCSFQSIDGCAIGSDEHRLF